MSLGLSLGEARGYPHNHFWDLWHAHERRLSRESIRFMDDVVATGGVQGEFKEHGVKRRKPKTTLEAVGFKAHYARRMKEGYPNRESWDKLQSDAKVREFTRSLDRNMDVPGSQFKNFGALDSDPLGGGGGLG